MAPQTKPELWTILAVLRWSTAFFQSHGIDAARNTAEMLLAHALKLQKIDLYLRYDQPLAPQELAAYKMLIKRRLGAEPVAYILGAKSFWKQTLAVSRDVLIPRPETEHLVETALQSLPASGGDGPWRVLDLGTGSGAVVLALAAERPGHLFFASDRSEQALKIARANAVRNGLGAQIRFLCGHWLQPFGAGRFFFDLIVSNPPYIPTSEISRLAPEIRRYEPLQALDGGPDGLEAIGAIVRAAGAFLKPRGHLLLEIGYDQQNAVEQLARTAGGYAHIEFFRDYAGHPRVARLTPGENHRAPAGALSGAHAAFSETTQQKS